MQFRSNEQASFSKLVAAHMNNPDGPLLLEGGTGLGKTRAYLHPISKSDKRVAICLPSHSLIDQLLASSDLDAVGLDVAVFRPARWFDNREEYLQQKASAMAARVMVCTSASVIIDQRLGGDYNGVTERDYIVFDEADQLPGVAALQSDCEITAEVLKDLGIKADTAEDVAIAVLNKRKEVEPEVKAASRMILECLDRPEWFWKAGMTDDGGAALFHRMPGRLLKKIANRPGVAFISATLSVGGRFDDFKRAMGIAEPSRLSCCIEPEHHGALKFTLNAEHPVDSDEWIDEVKATVLDAEKPCLVITTSHSTASQLEMDGVTVRVKGESTLDAAQRMGGDTLAAAAAWAGLDTPIQWKSIVIPRVPFQRPTVLDEQIESRYIDGRNSAIRRLRQGIGRGLRRPDSECHVYLLDSRAVALGQFVPERFRQAWRPVMTEGARQEVVLSKAERSSYYRKLALRHCGKQCQACDFVPVNDRQLHVHHLQPLCEGERQTTLEDLAVLCCNCHALAHSESPPLPVDALRALVLSAVDEDKAVPDQRVG